MTRTSLWFCLAAALLSAEANAAVITFAGQTSGAISGTVFTDSGLSFDLGTADTTNNRFFNWTTGSNSQALRFNGANGLTITNPGGKFSVTSLQFGVFIPGSTRVRFFLNGSATPDVDLLSSLNAFSSLSPTTWNNLDSLRIDTNGTGPVIAIDNINFSTVFATVPEPSSFALIGAIGAFGVWKRRRSQKAV